MGFFLKCKSIFRGFQFPTSHLFCFLQPLGQDGFQFARVLEAQLQVLKAANRRLAELGAVHSSQRFSNVGLCITCQKQRKKQLWSFLGGLPSLRCSALHCWLLWSVCAAVPSGWASWRGLFGPLSSPQSSAQSPGGFCRVWHWFSGVSTPGLGIWERSRHTMYFYRWCKQ